MADEIASIWIGVKADLNEAINTIDKFTKTKLPKLTATVDDSAFTNLNKHLDKKVEHLKSTQKYFKDNPLKVYVDDRELTDLNRKFDNFTRGKIFIPVQVVIDDIQLKEFQQRSQKKVIQKIDIEVGNVDYRNIGKSFDNIAEGIGNRIAKSINKSVDKAGKGKGIIGSILSIPSGIISGTISGVGQEIGRQFSASAVNVIEKRFEKSFATISESFTNAFLNTSTDIGNVLVKKLGIVDGLKGLTPIVDSVRKDIAEIVPVSLLNERLGIVEKRFVKFFDDLSRLSSLQTNIKNLGNIGQSLGKVATIPQEGMVRRRERIVRESAQNIRANYKPENAVQLDDSANGVVIVSGGFAGQKGQSSPLVGEKLKVLLGEQRQVIPVNNPGTDVSDNNISLGMPRWLAEAGLRIAQHNIIKGINPDSVEMARVAYEVFQQDKTKKITLGGYSAGGFVAHDAMNILKILGIPANAFSVGTPIWNKNSKNLDSEQFKAILREQDGVTIVVNKLKGLLGGLNERLTFMVEGKDHELSQYLAQQSTQELILKQVYGKNAPTPTRNQTSPEAYRLVGYKDEAEQLMQTLETSLSSTLNPTVTKTIHRELYKGLQQSKENFTKALNELDGELKEEVEMYIGGLQDGIDLLEDMYKIKKPVVATEEDSTKAVFKLKTTLKPLMETLHKKDVLEPIAKEFGITNARNTNKPELIEKLLNMADLNTLQKFLPHNATPSEDVLKLVQTRAQMPIQDLKTNLANVRTNITNLTKQNIGTKSGSQISDISESIEKEYQAVITQLSQGVKGDAKKLLEQQKLEIAKIRAKSIKEASEQVINEANSRKAAQSGNIPNVQGLAAVNRNLTSQALKNYEAIFKQVADISQVEFKPLKMPQLIVDNDRLKSLGAKAFYSIKQNQIIIDDEIAKILNNPARILTKYTEELKNITHESRHALQLNYGDLNLMGIALGKKPGVNFIPSQATSRQANYYANRSVQVAQGQNNGIPLPLSYKNAILQTEKDAYAFEELFTKKIISNVASNKFTTRIQSNTQGIQKMGNALNTLGSIAKSTFNAVNNTINSILNLGVEAGKTLPGGSFLTGLARQAIELKSQIVPLTLSFVGLTVVGKLSQIFGDFSFKSLNIARNFESLNQQLIAVSGSAIEGQNNIVKLTRQAKDLNLNKETVLQGSTGLLAATQGTNLEGEQSLQILQGVNTLIASRAVQSEQQRRALLAIEQMAGKGAIQAQELQTQLGQAIPGAVQIFARSQGLNPNQLRKQFQRGAFGSDSLVAFAQQAQAESEASIPDALNTSQGAANRLENSLVGLQEVAGKSLLPIQKFFDNTVASGVEFLTNNIGILTTGLNVLLIVASRPIWRPMLEQLWQLLPVLKEVSKEVIFNLKTALTGASVQNVQNVFSNIATNVKNLAVSLAPVMVELLVIQTVITIIDRLGIAFNNLAGEVKKFADNADKGVKRLKDYEKTGTLSTGVEPPKDYLDMMKRNFTDNPLRFLNPFDNEQARNVKTSVDTITEASKLVKSVSDLRKIADESFVKGKINNVSAIDKQLTSVQTNKRATVQRTPENSQLIKELTKKESELIKKRFEEFKPIGDIQGQINQRISDLKGTQKQIDAQVDKGYVTADVYGKATKRISLEIAELEKLQDKLTKTVGKIKNEFQSLQLSLEELDNELADNRARTDNNASIRRNQIDSGVISGRITQGDAQVLNQFASINTALEQLKNQQNYIRQSEALFNTDTAKRTLSSFNVNQNTGINQIKYLSKDAENPNDKYILEQYATLQQNKLELSKLQGDVLTSRKELQNSLKESGKSIIEFYRNIQRQNEQSALEIQKLNASIKLTSNTNKIRDILVGGFDGAISSYLESVIADIEAIDAQQQRKLDLQKSALDRNNQQFDLEKSAVELKRTLPSSDFKIPVEIDIDSLNSDDTISRIQNNMSDINTELESTNSNIAVFNLKTTSGNEIVNTLTTGVANVGSKILESVTSSENLNTSLTKIPETTNTIQSGFTGIGGVISSIVDTTAKWITGLTNAPSLLNNIFSLFNGGSGQPINPGGLIQQGLNYFGVGNLQGSQNVFAPVKNAPITSGFGHRNTGIPGASTYHDGIDYGVGTGTSVTAPTSGVISRVFTSTNGGGKVVEMKSIDNLGRTITQSFLHLNEQLVKQGQIVKQGQEIAKSGATGIGSGAHLHWRVHINGEKIDPQKFLVSKIVIPDKQALQVPQAYSNNQSIGNSGSTINADNARVSGGLMEFVKSKEGFNPNAYWDYGQYSIGHGTKAKSPTEKIDINEAGRRLQAELMEANAQVLAEVGNIKLSQNQIDALTSLVYNAGSLTQFPKLLANLKSGNMTGAAQEFLDVNKAGGKILEGLTIRRKQEAEMFLSGAVQASPGVTGVNLVNTGVKQSAAMSTQLNTAQAKQVEVENEKAEKDRLRAFDRQLEALRKSSRELGIQSRNTQKSQADNEFAAIFNPSPQQRFKKDVSDRRFEIDQLSSDTKEKILDIKRQRDLINKSLADENLPEEYKKPLRAQLTGYNDALTKLEKFNSQIQKNGIDRIKVLEQTHNREIQLRRIDASFASRTEEITTLQKRLEIAKANAAVNPYSEEARNIPVVETRLKLLEQDLNLEKQIEQLNREKFENKINNSEYQERVELLKKQSLATQELLGIQEKQAKQENDYRKYTRDLESSIAIGTGYQNISVAKLSQLERSFQKSPSFDTGEMAALRLDAYNIATAMQDLDYKKQLADIYQLGDTGQRTADEVKSLATNLEILNNLKLTDLKNQFNDALDADTIANFDRAITDLTNKQTLDSFALNLRKEKLTRPQNVNGNQFVTNRTQREIGTIEEKNRYNLELLNLDKQVATLRNSGIEVTENQVSQIKNDLFDIHNIKLDNLNTQFKTVANTLNDIAMQGLKSVGSGIADLVTKGGSLNDIFDNLFGTVLNQTLNMGISSLLSGVFGGMFATGGSVTPVRSNKNIDRTLSLEKGLTGREPMLAVVHKGEFLIPAKRYEQLESFGITSDKLLNAPLKHFADGGMVGYTPRNQNNTYSYTGKASNSSTIKLETTVINNQEYVTVDQARKLAEVASNRGAEKGYSMITNSMVNNQNYRNRISMQ